MSEEMLADIPCGPNVSQPGEAIKAHDDAGFDELYVNQIGPDQDVLFASYREQVLPQVQ